MSHPTSNTTTPEISPLLETAANLAPSLPLLMHGSGDVEPDDVDLDSVAILAELTANYISDLVTAAVDAHDILTDGSATLPPPRPPPSRPGPSSSGGDPVAEWVGAVGALTAPRAPDPPRSAIGTQAFIFPICHDAAQYGRVKEIQPLVRSVREAMMDLGGVLEIVKEEGKEESKDLVWPDLDILPVHR